MLPCDSRYILPCNTVAVTCEVGLPHALSQDESLMSTSLDHLTPTTLPWQSHRAQRGHVHSLTASQVVGEDALAALAHQGGHVLDVVHRGEGVEEGLAHPAEVVQVGARGLDGRRLNGGTGTDAEGCRRMQKDARARVQKAVRRPGVTIPRWKGGQVR